MNIVLSAENGTSTLVIPIVPIDVEIPTDSYKDEEFASVKGDLTIIGNKKLKEISWSSYFPAKSQTFQSTKSNTNPYANVDWINKYKAKKVPIRINITHSGNNLLNMPCRITEFSFTIDQAGDINYSISFKEYLIGTVKKV